MGVTRRNDELLLECQSLGIEIPKTEKKLKKRDIVRLLQNYHLSKIYPEGNVPEHLKYFLSIETPMLCFRYEEMKEDWKKSVWEDNNDWVAQTKINGARMVIFYSKEDGLHFYSRNNSVVNYLPIDYAEKIWLPNFNPQILTDAGVEQFIIDAEILCPEAKINTSLTGKISDGTVTEVNLNATTALLAIDAQDSLKIQSDNNIQLNFYPFHLLQLNRKDYSNVPWKDMNVELNKLMLLLLQSGICINFPETASTNKEEFYKKITSNGGEGIVFKNINEVYHPTESRYHKAWVKCKRLASETLVEQGLGDSIDGFVAGFELGEKGTRLENLVGTIIFAVYLRMNDGTEHLHAIAHVGGLTDALRNEITVVGDDGIPKLREDMYGKVAELDGMCISAKSLALMHPRLIQFRPDKNALDCIMEESTLRKLIV